MGTVAIKLPSATLEHLQGGARRVTLYIPAPHPKCSDNGRSHYHVKAKHVKAQREASWAAAKTIQPIRFDWANIKFRYVLGKAEAGTYRPRDLQNAITALKGAIDGIVDAGIIPDDSHKHLVGLSGEIVTEKGGQTRVEIDINEVWL